MQTLTIEEKPNSERIIKQDHTADSHALINTTIEKLAAQLEQGYSDEMKNYLRAMAHFHNYSLNNLFLILGQKPNATRIAGFQTWKSLNRRVKKGEKGIRILAPIITHYKKPELESPEAAEKEQFENAEKNLVGFRTVCVFDESQTDGDKMPEPATAQGEPAMLLPALEQKIRSAGIVLEYRVIGNALGISQNGKITIQPGMEPAATFNTLIHEYAHSILHLANPSENAGASENSKPKPSPAWFASITKSRRSSPALIISNFGTATRRLFSNGLNKSGKPLLASSTPSKNNYPTLKKEPLPHRHNKKSDSYLPGQNAMAVIPKIGNLVFSQGFFVYPMGQRTPEVVKKMEESEIEIRPAGSAILDPLLEDKRIYDAMNEAYPENQLSHPILISLSNTCPICGSNRGQWRGYRIRKYGSIVHRRWCCSCNHWFQLSTT